MPHLRLSSASLQVSRLKPTHPGPGSLQGTDASVFAGLTSLVPGAISTGWHGMAQFMSSRVVSDLWGLQSTAQWSQAKNAVGVRHPAAKALFWVLFSGPCRKALLRVL